MTRNKKLAIGLGLGALAVGTAAFFGARRAGLLGRSNGGPVQTRLAPQPPMVGERKVGERTLKLYKAPNIPIDQRVRLIQDRVWNGVTDPRIRKLALELTHGCPRNDGECEARKIYAAVKNRIRYTGDVAPVRHPDGTVDAIDYFQAPWPTWEYKGGDCDDHNGLLAALLSVIGIPSRIRVTAPGRFSDWQHVYVVAGMPKMNPKKWVALDTTLPGRTKFSDEARFGKNRDYIPHKDYAA